MAHDAFQRARSFIHTHARLLERLLFAVEFERADPGNVGRLVSAYQNADGGLGHALEPDVRSPESQPLFVEVGLAALKKAGVRDQRLSLAVCAFLEGVSDESGLVPVLLPSALRSPRAAHWTSTGEPGINPTASICGLLHFQGVEHPWLDRATRTCCDLILDDTPREAHSLLCAATLAEYLPDRQLAAALTEQIARALPVAAFYIATAPVTEYGLTPLHFAPSPASPLRRLFTDEQIDGHLTDLMTGQQEDGGWPVNWDPPGPAARNEWSGKVTLEALSVLTAYGRIEKAG